MNLGQWHHFYFMGLIGLAFLFLTLQLLGGHHSGSDNALHSGDLSHGDLSPHPSSDLPGDIHEGPFHWLLGVLHLGKLPASLSLTLFSFLWGSWGLLADVWLQSLFSPPWLAFVAASSLSLLPTLVCTRFLADALGKLFAENTAASHPEDLIGCVGTVISGQIPLETAKGFGRAHVYTEHGTLLQLACVTQQGSLAIPRKHQTVFVTGYQPEQKLYTVVLYDSPDFQAYLSGPSPYQVEQRLAQSQQHLQQQQKT